MSIQSRLEPAALTGEIPVIAECGCADDVHTWSAPAVEHIDAVDITRWRCVCTHCQCDGLHLVIDPTGTGEPQHEGTESSMWPERQLPDQWVTGDADMYARLLAGLRAL